MSARDWGRFTARGGAEVERRVAHLVDEVGGVVEQQVPSRNLAALVLLGGYGRGEGGVERRHGEELPHNNLDFVVLTEDLDGAARDQLQQDLDRSLAPVGQRSGVGLDLSLLPVSQLRRSPCLVMWYDMRFGHKTIRGDEALVPSFRHFTRDRVPALDVLALLVNRSTLLVINQFLLDRGARGESIHRTLVKHAVKAIIGVGDSLLYARGQYHWSYRVKQQRMRTLDSVDPAFRELYEEAMEFRFLPDYTRFADRDPEQWTEQLWSVFAPVHLECERIRLGEPELDWEGYLERAGAAELRRILASPRALARALWHGRRSRRPSLGLGLAPQLGFWLATPRERLSLLLPVVAHSAGGEEGRELARRLLGCPDASPETLRLAYLRAWAGDGDSNFELMLERLGISLEEER